MSRDPILGAFASLRKTPLRAVAKLKAERSYRQTRLLLPQLKMYGAHRYITEKKSPRNWNDLIGISNLAPSSTWLEEFGWLSHRLCANAHAITAFLKKRRLFGAAYLLGRYREAADFLTEIEAEHGLSFWLAERQLMLKQASDGFDGHKQHLSAIQSSTTDSVVSYLITLISSRLDPHTTYEIFSSKIKTAIEDLKKEGYSNFAALVELHGSPWTTEWKSKLQYLIVRLSTESLIDSYNLSIKILAHVDPTSLSSYERETLRRIFSDLRSHIDDSQLLHLEWALLGDASSPVIDERTESYLKAYDHFVCGRFDHCITDCIQLIENDPGSFEYYLLLARSQACCSLPLTLPWDRRCLASRLIHALSHIADNSLDLDVFSVQIKSISLTLGDNHLGISLWQFNEREFTGDVSISSTVYASVASRLHSFELLSQMSCPLAQMGMQNLQKDFSAHPSVQFIFARFGGQRFRAQDLSQLSDGFRRVAEATIAQQSGEQLGVLELLRPFIRESATTREQKYHASATAELEFSALISLNHPEEAAESLLRNYVTNRNRLRHIDFDQLVDGAKDDRWPHLRESVYWPTLVFLRGSDVQDVYESVDDFISLRGLPGPTAILNILDLFPQFATRVLLRDVLVPRVLARGALWASTPEERRTIRTIVLQKLFEIAPEDQGRVITELSELEQIKLLEEAYKNIEGPKFFFEFSDKNREMAALLQGSFEQYLAYRDYEEKGGQLTGEDELLEMAKSGAPVRQNAEKKSDTSDILLSNIATLVFGEYLWGQNKGLNATLGTRIRHGALDNQLKRIFGANALLATKHLDGAYRCDAFVEKTIEWLPPDKQASIKAAYVRFTIEINTLYEDLINNILRIKVPPVMALFYEKTGIPTKEFTSEDGLLDFTRLFKEEIVTKLKGSTLKSSNALVAELQNIFVAESHLVFNEVKRWINTSVSAIIGTSLDNLNTSIMSLLDDSPTRAALRAKILDAKAGFAHDLRIIQNWFSVAERSSIASNTVKKVVEASWRVVNFASNGRLGSVSCTTSTDRIVEPHEEILLYEVLSILMRNIAKHSGVLEGQEVIYAYSINTDGSQELTVSNRVAAPESYEKQVAAANMRLAEPPDPRVLQRDPGGTGLARVRALLSQMRETSVQITVKGEQAASRFIVILSF